MTAARLVAVCRPSRYRAKAQLNEWRFEVAGSRHFYTPAPRRSSPAPPITALAPPSPRCGPATETKPFPRSVAPARAAIGDGLSSSSTSGVVPTSCGRNAPSPMAKPVGGGARKTPTTRRRTMRVDGRGRSASDHTWHRRTPRPQPRRRCRASARRARSVRTALPVKITSTVSGSSRPSAGGYGKCGHVMEWGGVWDGDGYVMGRRHVPA